MDRFQICYKRFFTGWFIALAVILTGCGSGGTDVNNRTTDTGMTRVSAAVEGPAELAGKSVDSTRLSAKPVPGDVGSAQIEVERGGVLLHTECRNLQGGEASVVFEFDAPSGSNTNFTGRAFSQADCQGTLLYDGRTLGVELLSGVPITVQIHLSFLGSVPPTVQTNPATGVTSNCAQLNATVNPAGFQTVIWFEFGTDHTYATSTLFARHERAGAANESIQTQICGLTPATVYHVRAVASNGGNLVFGNDQDFTTLAEGGTDTASELLFPDDLPPSAVTSSATAISDTGAILNGASNPNGVDSQIFFEWGLDTTYGRTTPLQAIGKSFGEVAVTAQLSGLVPGKNYHFRIIVFNIFGVRVGGDQTFQAQSAILSEIFEAGIGNISISNGIWEIGVTTSAPSAAHTGEKAACTVLNANYPDNVSSRLMLFPIRLPAINADDELHLIFYQWFVFGGGSSALGSRGDFGQVQVREEISTGVFGDWVSLSTFSGASPEWTRSLVDLSAYAGKVIQIGFLLDQGFGGVAVGWCIDDLLVRVGKVKVVGKADTLIEDFEQGLDHGFGDNGIWQEGPPTSGPMAAHSGQNVAGTVLAGNYSDNTSSRWVTPSLRLPALNVGELLKMRFWHWFQFGGGSTALGSRGDFGRIQIREELSPGSWGAWSTLESFSGASGIWTTTLVDVSSTFAGKKVQIGFLLDQGFGGVGAGWYLDDISLNIALAP